MCWKGHCRWCEGPEYPGDKPWHERKDQPPEWVPIIWNYIPGGFEVLVARPGVSPERMCHHLRRWKHAEGCTVECKKERGLPYVEVLAPVDKLGVWSKAKANIDHVLRGAFKLQKAG